MAKTRGPLHSSEAHGTIGDSLTFSKYKGINRAFKKSKPKNPRSVDQQLQRSYMTQAILSWRDLDQASKQYWEQLAQSQKMSGYNYFISDYIRTMISPPPPPPPPLPPITDGLIHYWPLDEQVGLVAYDSVGSCHFDITGATHVPGKMDYALQFNGSSDYAESQQTSGQIGLDGNPSFTISLGAYVLSWTGAYVWAGLFGWGQTYITGKTIHISKHENTHWTAFHHHSRDLVFAVSSGVWVYITGTYNSTNNTGKLYINASYKGQLTNFGPFTLEDTTLRLAKSHIAHADFNKYYHGRLDEMTIYNRPLEQSEIDTMYAWFLAG